MKYIVDTTTNKSFTQIIGLSESDAAWEYPFAVQFRSDGEVLEKLSKLLKDSIELRDKIGKLYHESKEHRSMYHEGTSIFIAGSITLTSVVKTTYIYIFVNNLSLAPDGILSPENLLTAVKKAAKVVAKRYE